jgi:ABC-type sugar transport system substrate-binding protein
MLGSKKLALFLRALDNEYQKLQKSDFLQRSRLHSIAPTVFDAGNDSRTQFRQIEDVLRSRGRGGFDALLVNPVLESTLEPLAAEAARQGVGWVSLNRSSEYVPGLRRAYPKPALFCVNPDQHQIGRIQGEQVLTMLRGGGSLFYICGPLATSSARQRLSSIETVLAGSGIRTYTCACNWSEDDGENAMAPWLGETSREWRRCVVAAQNDPMGRGARKALLNEAAERRRPDLARVRVTGCDGLPSGGQRAVADGRLAATVVVPTTAGRAVDLLVPTFEKDRPPQGDLILAVTSFPDLEVLARTESLLPPAMPHPTKRPSRRPH